MLHVDLDKILTEEDAVSKIKEVFDHVEHNHEIYVVTNNGRPAVAVISIDDLEQHMGEKLDATGMSTPLPAADDDMSANPLPPPPPMPEMPAPVGTMSTPPLPPSLDNLPPLSGTDSLGSAPVSLPPPMPAPSMGTVSAGDSVGANLSDIPAVAPTAALEMPGNPPAAAPGFANPAADLDIPVTPADPANSSPLA